MSDFTLPEDYEEHLEAARRALEALPRDENWEQARQVLASAPGREEVEAAGREGARALAIIAEFERALHTEHHPGQAAPSARHYPEPPSDI